MMQIQNLKIISFGNKSTCSKIVQGNNGDFSKQDTHNSIIPNYKFFIFNYKNRNVTPVVLIDKNTGKKVAAKVIKHSKGTYSVESKGETIGVMLTSLDNAPFKGDNYPDFYKNASHLFINSINSNGKYKGVGTELIKQLVRDSNKRGLKGRVCLNTTTTNPAKGSPIPFYLKFGFEATDSDTQKIILDKVNEGKIITDGYTGISMFLPENRINEILNR